MFKDYYGILGISSDATTEEISAAVEKYHGKISNVLLDEIQMVFRNKSLKLQYDTEYLLYSKSDSKQFYKITNPILERELIKIETYVEIRARENIERFQKEEKSWGGAWRWIILIIVIMLVKECVFSYNRGKNIERFRRSEIYTPAGKSSSETNICYITNKLT